jgi:lipopolysaccharide/colanic/teichoic acid biosynthesis glycosyltransferase
MSSGALATRRGSVRSSVAWWCKSGMDRIGALLLLILASPILVFTALLVRLTSEGPVLHRRRVVGLHGAEIQALKFRTMVKDADAMLDRRVDLREALAKDMKLRDDPRVTPFGRLLRRTSLDELPQLVNVLRGEMSLVGPRMISREEIDRYGEVMERRLAFKPGMTGLWQISGRNYLRYDERIELDAQYMDNWSLWLDCKILLKTIPAVMSMRGAY